MDGASVVSNALAPTAAVRSQPAHEASGIETPARVELRLEPLHDRERQRRAPVPTRRWRASGSTGARSTTRLPPFAGESLAKRRHDLLRPRLGRARCPRRPREECHCPPRPRAPTERPQRAEALSISSGPERQASDLARELDEHGARERAAEARPEAVVERRDAGAQARRHRAERGALGGSRPRPRSPTDTATAASGARAPDAAESRGIEPREAVGLEARGEDGGHEGSPRHPAR